MSEDQERRMSALGIPRVEPEELDEMLSVRDPEFPDRPQHRHFLMLSKIIVAMDNRVEDSGMEELETIVKEVVDPETIGYMSDQRVRRYETILKQNPLAGRELLTWLYREAFIVGVEFERLRPDPPEDQD